MDWSNVVMEPVTAMLARVAGFLPILLGVLVILIAG